MTRNIVVCSDGTGNTFDRRTTNVTRLVRSLAVDDASRQVVLYDQGMGTGGGRAARVRDEAEDTPALVMLPGPTGHAWSPRSLERRARGLLFGYGLEQNVREMYEAIARLHAEGDRLWLFGFSRGAFTVRALAGLLYRCGLPGTGDEVEARFARAWELYQPMRPDSGAVLALRDRQLRRLPAQGAPLGGDGERDVAVSRRDGRVTFHATVDRTADFAGRGETAVPPPFG